MLKIERPRDTDIHTVADFAEALCLVTMDRVLSGEGLVNFVKDYDGELDDDAVEDCYAQLRWRQVAFGDAYPFALDANRHIMSAPETLSERQALYAFLLLCANLPMLERKEWKGLTDAFERAALAALRRLWPQSAVARSFGKNETEYAGSKWERMSQLGRDIGGRPQLSATTFRGRDSGDGGIDLVAWLNLDDFETENIPSALAQCACSREEWSPKQMEISGARLARHLVPTHPWMEMIFMPISFRNNQGRWAVDGDVASTIIMDRLRVMKFLDPGADTTDISPPNIVGDFLGYRLDLV